MTDQNIENVNKYLFCQRSKFELVDHVWYEFISRRHSASLQDPLQVLLGVDDAGRRAGRPGEGRKDHPSAVRVGSTHQTQHCLSNVVQVDKSCGQFIKFEKTSNAVQHNFKEF